MRLARTFALVALLSAVAAPAADARPAGRLEPVLVLEHGRVVLQREHFLGPDSLPAGGQPPAAPRAAAAAAKPVPKGRATRLALDALLALGAIDQPSRDARQAALRQTLRAYQSLIGTRKKELGAVIDNADAIASSKQLTPSRLNAVFATLYATRTRRGGRRARSRGRAHESASTAAR
jgi:hypothetical protein